MLDLISRGAQGHGPVHLLVISAAELGFSRDGEEKGWVPVSISPLRMMSGPVQHFYSFFWMPGDMIFLPSYLSGRALWGLSMWIFKVLYNYLPLPICGKEIKCCQEPPRVGAFGTDSFLARLRRKMFLVDFVAKGMVVVPYFGSALSSSSPLLQHVRELSEFPSLMSFDRSKWPRCLLRYGWLPGLGGTTEGDPWATSFGDLACGELERCLCAYTVDFSGLLLILLWKWLSSNIWTDGSREDFSSVGGFEVAGAGVHLPASDVAFECSVWGTAEEYGDDRLERCRAFLPVLGVMQTVQRAEFWGAVVATQAYWPCHRTIG